MDNSTAVNREVRVSGEGHALQGRYRAIRDQTVALCEPLQIEDYVVQTLPEVSPPKWHLAHTTWFFETFLLAPYLSGYRSFHPQYHRLFNSYYETVGPYHPRPERGLLARPTVEEVLRYRRHVDAAMLALLDGIASHPEGEAVARRTVIGLHHEQQHQELLLTDIKHIFGYNPLHPVYRALPEPPAGPAALIDWIEFDEGVRSIGHGGEGFGYDNEFPRHPVYLQPFRLASRPVTNGEYIEFMEAGGYAQPAHWLAEGWNAVRAQGWQAPLYWERRDGRWWQMTLGGLRPVDEHAPVAHVSYFEADAFARWAGKRLPTEAEWEVAAQDRPIGGNLRQAGYLQPIAAGRGRGLQQVYGDVWEWTQSAYTPYPGFHALEGSLGEYNGKFMCGQLVLRGGSCVTPADHVRASYRNFFYPGDRWQFSGFRLAA